VSIDVLLAGGLSLKRLALRLVLEKGSEFTVVGETIDVAEALAMCLLDVNSKGMGGSYLGDGKICVVILKTEAERELIDALRTVMGGDSHGSGGAVRSGLW